MVKKIQFELIVRNWDYDIFNNPILMKIQNLEDTSIEIKDSGYSFCAGGVLVYVTIISVAANIAVISDILYKYFKKNKNSRIKLIINREEITIEGPSETVKEILLSHFKIK